MDPIIKTEGPTKRYGDFTALNQLDITVNKGEILGYLGPNGAGETSYWPGLTGAARDHAPFSYARCRHTTRQ
jgi:ABC-2 type transport system ATP-binding protein